LLPINIEKIVISFHFKISQLTNSMEQSPSSEADIRSDSQEIPPPRILWYMYAFLISHMLAACSPVLGPSVDHRNIFFELK
jgi:hypothetical protein